MKNCLQGNRGFKVCMKSCFEGNKGFSSSTTSGLTNSHHQFSLTFSTSPFHCKASADYVDAVTACSWNNQVVASDDPVVVLFWAPGCTPSQMFEPTIIDELSKQYAVTIVYYRLNTEDYPTIVSQYEIKNIPMVVVFKYGEKKVCFDGQVSKSALAAAIEECLK